MQRVLVLGILLVLCLSPALLHAQSGSLQAHSPIIIQRNADFSEVNGVRRGAGTAQDPYIIEGWLINDDNAANGILVSNTDAYLTIRNCQVQNSLEYGIALDNVTHVIVENCSVSDSSRGFLINASVDVRLIGNTASFNADVGFAVLDSQQVELIENIARNNWAFNEETSASFGIYVDETSQTVGQDNLSSGHALDISVLQQADDAEEDPLDLFAALPAVREASCTQVFNEFFLFVARAPDAPELNEPYCAQLLAVLRSLPPHMRGRINQFFFQATDEEAVGMFTGVGTVRLFDIKHLKDFIETVFHEIGHVLQDRLFSDSQRDRWLQLHQQSDLDPDNYATINVDGFDTESGQWSSYGMVDDWEDFSTMFEAYARDTVALVQRAERLDREGKPILMEKVRFVASLFAGQLFAYRELLSWDSAAAEVSITLQRASVTELPSADDGLFWEDFAD